MVHHPARRRTHPWLLVPVVLAACELPNFEGPQIQSPPRGYLLQNEAYQRRRMFPEREILMHTAWVNAGNGPFSGIYVNAHRGDLGLDAVAEAQAASKAIPDNAETTYSDIEPLEIDGRSAWGWAERLHTAERGLDWVAYRAVVSYDTVSYAIEFYSGDNATKLAAPDTLRAIVSSFAVGRTEWNLPLIAMLAGLALLGASVARTRHAERTARLRSINLVSVAKEDRDQRGALDTTDVEPHGARPAPAGSRRPPPLPVAPTRMGGGPSQGGSAT